MTAELAQFVADRGIVAVTIVAIVAIVALYMRHKDRPHD